MPDEEKRPDEPPARPSPANVAATLLLWAVLLCAGLAALVFVIGAALAPKQFN